MSQERSNFGSRLGIILATAGAAVGLGNVWRFPYMTGANGGAAFILIYLVSVLLLGIPCMISEFIIGRHGASNTARAYSKLSNGTAWKYVGFLGVLTGFLITGYYAVVSGWCLQYIYAASAGELSGDPEYISNYFSSFSGNPWRPILCAGIIFGLTHYIIIKGVKRGIERVSKIFMPILFLLLVGMVVASCLLPGGEGGIAFLLRPDFSHIDGQVLLGALGQSFYSLSIGMGCLCTYASYFKRETNLLGSAIQISLVDTLIAILAGLMIFPVAFSVGVNPDSGPSLIFITLPNVFQQAFSGVPFVGTAISISFYLLLTLAAITSLISLHEVSTAFLHEEFHLSRKAGATIVTLACFFIGACCSLSLGACDVLSVGGRSLFDLFDFVTGQLFLPIGGLLTSLFLGWYVPKKVVEDEFTNGGTISRYFFRPYLFVVRFVCPLFILLILLHQLGVFSII